MLEAPVVYPQPMSHLTMAMYRLTAPDQRLDRATYVSRLTGSTSSVVADKKVFLFGISLNSLLEITSYGRWNGFQATGKQLL